jgi:hypothetical protein
MVQISVCYPCDLCIMRWPKLANQVNYAGVPQYDARSIYHRLKDR